MFDDSALSKQLAELHAAIRENRIDENVALAHIKVMTTSPMFRSEMPVLCSRHFLADVYDYDHTPNENPDDPAIVAFFSLPLQPALRSLMYKWYGMDGGPLPRRGSGSDFPQLARDACLTFGDASDMKTNALHAIKAYAEQLKQVKKRQR